MAIRTVMYLSDESGESLDISNKRTKVLWRSLPKLMKNKADDIMNKLFEKEKIILINLHFL